MRWLILTGALAVSLALAAIAYSEVANAQVEGLWGGWTAEKYDPDHEGCNTIEAQRFVGAYPVTLVAEWHAAGQSWTLWDPFAPSGVSDLEFLCHETFVWIFTDGPTGTIQAQWIQQ